MFLFRIFELIAQNIIREWNDKRKRRTKYGKERGRGGEEEWEMGIKRESRITEKEPNQGLAPSPLPLSLFILWKTGSHM